MRNRPRIELKPTILDIILELLGWFAIIGVWIFVFLNYSNLPETIPTHFDITGKADQFGSKDSIITLQSVLTLMFFGITLLIKLPHKLNYPLQITEKNAKLQYTYATRLIRIIKLAIAIVFGLLFSKTILNSKGIDYGLGVYFYPIIFCLFVVPIVVYLYLSLRKQQA